MPAPSATISDFKALFVRDFVYGTTPDKVLDADLTNALNLAASDFNTALWVDDAETKTAFLYLSAFWLADSLQAAGGLSGVNLSRGALSKGDGAIQTKSVGNVSVAFALPEGIVNDPMLHKYQRNRYGQIYLGLLTPRLVGNIGVVSGWDDTGALTGGV